MLSCLYCLEGCLLLLALIVGIKLFFTWWIWLATLIWASAVYFMKMKFSALGEEIEHYRAANAVLLGGLPYQKSKSR